MVRHYLNLSRIENGEVRLLIDGWVRERETEGQEIAVRIEKIDPETKRISLALLGDEEEEKAEELEDFQQYVGKAPGSFGSLGDALQKKMGTKTKE